MQKTGLKEILEPVTEAEFFKSNWPNEPLFISSAKGKLESIFNLPELQNLESLAANRKLKVRACLPDFDDEYSSILLEPTDALKAYRNNMTLVFDSMQKENEIISDTLNNMRADLGLVTGGAENDLCKSRSIIYATPAGCGTRLHFDANANFIIQISGSKRWMLAANQSVKNPTERFTTGALEMPAALEKQCHAELLDSLPEDAIEIDMQPGCVLFVPRGYWHATETFEDSLSLNFTFSQPTWADIFTKSMQEHLLNSSSWRELADGLESRDESRKKSAILKFEKLVKELALELPNISGLNLLNESGLLK